MGDKLKISEILLRIFYGRMLKIDEEVRPLADLIVEAITPQIEGWYRIRLKIWSCISSNNELRVQYGYGYLAGFMSITMGIGSLKEGLAIIDEKIKQGVETGKIKRFNYKDKED